MEQKHSYIVELEATLATSREMLELLKNRKSFLLIYINTPTTDLYSTYQVNEYKITLIETEGKIKSLEKIIFEKEQYFKNFAAQFDIDRAEMEKNWLEVFNRAQKKRQYIPALEKFMASADWEKANNFIESKVHAYQRMKSLLKTEQ